MTLVALPWFVLSTTGSPARTSVVMASAAAGLALCGIPGGWVASRLGVRRAMLVSNATRAPLIGLIPFLHEAGALRFWMLPVIAFAVEAHTAPYQGAQAAVLAELVEDNSALLGPATALFQAAQRASNLVGPGLAGALIALVGASSILWIDASTYVAAFFLTVLIPASVRGASEVEEIDRLADGARFLFRDTFLRLFVPMAALWEGVFAALFVVLFPLIAFERYHRNAHIAGGLLAAMGAGAILGSLVAYRIVPHYRPVRLGAVAFVGQVLPIWMLAYRVPPIAAIIAMGASGIFQPISYAPTFSHITLRIPVTLRPTVMAALATITLSAAPIAVAFAGPLVIRIGLRATMTAVMSVLTIGSVAYVFVGPRAAGEAGR